MKRKACLFPLLTLLAVALGCATIVTGKHQTIPINSDPSQATVTITDKNSIKVFEGATPTSVTLKKSDGYFSGQDYTVNISKEGYESRVFILESRANGWYIFGNILLGGLIGWLIVDPATGAMYKLEPERVDAALVKTKTSDSGETGLHIILLDDIPSQFRTEMIRIR